jgi:hypothetical protein
MADDDAGTGEPHVWTAKASEVLCETVSVRDFLINEFDYSPEEADEYLREDDDEDQDELEHGQAP